MMKPPASLPEHLHVGATYGAVRRPAEPFTLAPFPLIAAIRRHWGAMDMATRAEAMAMMAETGRGEAASFRLLGFSLDQRAEAWAAMRIGHAVHPAAGFRPGDELFARDFGIREHDARRGRTAHRGRADRAQAPRLPVIPFADFARALTNFARERGIAPGEAFAFSQADACSIMRVSRHMVAGHLGEGLRKGFWHIKRCRGSAPMITLTDAALKATEAGGATSDGESA